MGFDVFLSFEMGKDRSFTPKKTLRMNPVGEFFSVFIGVPAVPFRPSIGFKEKTGSPRVGVRGFLEYHG
jgi:hypothetical protein